MADFVLADGEDRTPDQEAGVAGVDAVTFDLEALDIRSFVDEGERLPVTLAIANEESSPNVYEPDYCLAASSPGYAVAIEVYVDGSEVTTFYECAPAGRTTTRDVTLPPMEDGTRNVELRLVSQNTRETLDAYTELVTVTLDGGGGDDGTDDGGSQKSVSISDSIEAPSEVPVGEQFTITVPVSNETQSVSLGDPDYCAVGAAAAGLNTEVSVSVGGTTIGESMRCVGILGSGQVQVQVDGAAAGQQQMEVSVSGAVSGSQFDSGTFTVTGVRDDGGDGGDDGGDGKDGCSPPSGGCPGGEVYSYDKCNCVSESEASFWEQRTRREKAAIVGSGALLGYALLSG